MKLSDLGVFLLEHCCDTVCVCVFRGPSVKRSSGMERSRSSNWDTSDENKNKLVKAASTSKLLAKVVKNAERYVHTLRWKSQNTASITNGREATDTRTRNTPERSVYTFTYA